MNKAQKVLADTKTPHKGMEALKKYIPHYFDKNSNFDIVKFTTKLKTKN